MGRKKKFTGETSHISIYVSKEDKKFVEKFGRETYRDITGVMRLAISLLRGTYNEEGAKHGL